MRSRSAKLLALLTVVGLAASCKPATTPAAPSNGDGSASSVYAEGAASVRAKDAQERFVVELGDAPTLGPADAAVTVVMFSDFECPYCAQGLDTLMRLRELYPEDVRIAYKAYPLDNHSNALFAAMAARTAQAQGKFWEFHHQLFSGQRLEPRVILTMADAVGVDVDTLIRDLDALEYGPEVRRDARQGRRLGVTSTPTFFVNGRVVSGAKPIGEFDEMVGEERRHAEALRAAGVPGEQLYAEITADGYEKVEFRDGRRGLDPDAVFPVPIGDSPTKGPLDAPVTIVTFSDFQCPFCARGDQILGRVEEAYGDKLRIVHKNNPLPFHRAAMPAARASLAAHAQGKFWAFHDALYAREARFATAELEDVAREVGLDMQLFQAAMDDATLQDIVEADLALAMAVGVTGTPAFFINGRPIEGAVPEIHFRLLIEEELERAEAARKAGVAPGEMYDHLTHTAVD